MLWIGWAPDIVVDLLNIRFDAGIDRISLRFWKTKPLYRACFGKVKTTPRGQGISTPEQNWTAAGPSLQLHEEFPLLLFWYYIQQKETYRKKLRNAAQHFRSIL
jgi:hypothetical protein